MNFTEYLNTEYSELYPKPKRVIKGLDWKFYGAVIASASAILLAASRTALAFYSAAVLSSALFGTGDSWITSAIAYVDLVVVILAVEGGLAFYSALRSEQRGSVSVRAVSWLIGILATISVIAGVWQSLGLVQNLDPLVLEYFSYVMAIALGSLSSIAALLSGDVVGVQIGKFQRSVEEANAQHEKAINSWMGRARSTWKNRPKSAEPVDTITPGPRDEERVRLEVLKRVKAGRPAGVAEVADALNLNRAYVWSVVESWKDSKKS